MFRFVLGLVTGVVVGVAAATISSSESGQDIRVEFERIRSDIEKRDFEALGTHLEERFKELQANLEERFAQMGDQAGEAGETLETVEVSPDEAAGAPEEGEAEPVTA
jgi:gas vesicle protein